jgi:hypothetical protein
MESNIMPGLAKPLSGVVPLHLLAFGTEIEFETDHLGRKYNQNPRRVGSIV